MKDFSISRKWKFDKFPSLSKVSKKEEIEIINTMSKYIMHTLVSDIMLCIIEAILLYGVIHQVPSLINYIGIGILGFCFISGIVLSLMDVKRYKILLSSSKSKKLSSNIRKEGNGYVVYLFKRYYFLNLLM